MNNPKKTVFSYESRSTATNVIRFLDQELCKANISELKKEKILNARRNIEAAYKLSFNDFESMVYVDLADQVKKTGELHVYLYGVRTAVDFSAMGKKATVDEKFTEAISHFSRAIRCNPRNPTYWCDRAEAYHRMNDMVKAIADCRQAINLKLECARAYNRLGLIYYSTNNRMTGIECCKTAVNYQPRNLNYRLNYFSLREIHFSQLDTKLRQNANSTNQPWHSILDSNINLDLFEMFQKSKSYVYRDPKNNPSETFVYDDGKDIDSRNPINFG